MKNAVFATLYLLVALQSMSQVVTLHPGIDDKLMIPGDTITILIKNNQPQAVSFYPFTSLEQSDNPIFINKQTFIKHLQAQGGQIAAIKELARIYKSPYFLNTHLEATPTGELAALSKFYAFIPSVTSVFHRQSGDYWHQAYLLLTEAEIFKPNQLMRVTCSSHQLGQGILLNGDTVLLDFDPAEPRFLDTMTNGKGYMSASELRQFPQMLDSQPPYCYSIKNKCVPLTEDEQQTEHYKTIFTTGSIILSAEATHRTADISGMWTMPPYSSFSINYPMPNYFLKYSDALDSLYQVAETIYKTGDSISAYKIFGKILNTSWQEAIRALRSNDLFVYREDKPTFSEYIKAFNEDQFTATIHIPSTDSSLEFGGDVSFPFRIQSIRASKPVVFEDTTFSKANFNLYAYKKDIEDVVSPPQISKNEIQFIHKGHMNPKTDLRLTVYFNPRIYNFGNEIKAALFSNGIKPTITITSTPQNKRGKK